MAQTTKQELVTFEHVTMQAPTTVSSAVKAYRESVETDVLVQLRHNIQELEDLHGRLRFAMGELQTLLKRS